MVKAKSSKKQKAGVTELPVDKGWAWVIVAGTWGILRERALEDEGLLCIWYPPTVLLPIHTGWYQGYDPGVSLWVLIQIQVSNVFRRAQAPLTQYKCLQTFQKKRYILFRSLHPFNHTGLALPRRTSCFRFVAKLSGHWHCQVRSDQGDVI